MFVRTGGFVRYTYVLTDILVFASFCFVKYCACKSKVRICVTKNVHKYAGSNGIPMEHHDDL